MQQNDVFAPYFRGPPTGMPLPPGPAWQRPVSTAAFQSERYSALPGLHMQSGMPVVSVLHEFRAENVQLLRANAV
jgi:hypothetical protein